MIANRGDEKHVFMGYMVDNIFQGNFASCMTEDSAVCKADFNRWTRCYVEILNKRFVDEVECGS